ncbi:MAG TPA: hypothetical protein PLU58_09770 [Saprospiraceae bacterium]|nr:hypothetical protein [Saprospiraceae bacterium]
MRTLIEILTIFISSWKQTHPRPSAQRQCIIGVIGLYDFIFLAVA